MKLLRKAIFTAASPNTQFDDVLAAKLQLIQPWKWYDKQKDLKFVSALKQYLKIENVHLIDSGRSALQVLLQSLGVDSNDEVIAPSFTCVVVANAIRYTGAIPVYLDTNEQDFNAQYENVSKLITPKTKAIIVQHTFGKRVDVEGIKGQLKRMSRNEIYIIEDFAHVIQKDINLIGQAGFLTFGIEKVISSVRGGAIITNDSEISSKVDAAITKLPEFPRFQIFKSLANPIFWWIAIPLHSVGIGRFTIGAMIRWVWRKMGFLGIMVEGIENKAIKPDWFPCKMAPTLSVLGLKQLEKLDYYNEHRIKISKIYHENLSNLSDTSITEDSPVYEDESYEASAQESSDSIDNFDETRVYLRYPILLKNEDEFKKIWELSRSLRVTAGNWFERPLYGSTVDNETYEKLCYVPALTPITSKKCGLTLNLPKSVNMS